MSCEGCVGAVKRVLGKMEGKQFYLKSPSALQHLTLQYCLSHKSFVQIEHITSRFHKMILFCIYILSTLSFLFYS